VRLFIAVTLFVLIFFFKIYDKNIIIALFVIGVFSDAIDGPIARGLNKVTEFGAILDSTSDRALLLPIAVYGLLEVNVALLCVLIAIELLNGAVSLYYKSMEIYLESNIFGKTKMFLACVVFIAMLYMWPTPPSALFIFILWFTIPFTFLSMFTRINELHSKHLSAYECTVRFSWWWHWQSNKICSDGLCVS
jgi:phosphatidylglycerophosphate synthase